MKRRLEHIEELAEQLLQEIQMLKQEMGLKENPPKNVPKILPQLEELANGRKDK